MVSMFFSDRIMIYALVFWMCAVFIGYAYNGNLTERDTKLRHLCFSILAHGTSMIVAFDGFVSYNELGFIFLPIFIITGCQFTYWSIEFSRVYSTPGHEGPDPRYNI